jgi:hypothetical protein
MEITVTVVQLRLYVAAIATTIIRIQHIKHVYMR